MSSTRSLALAVVGAFGLAAAAPREASAQGAAGTSASAQPRIIRPGASATSARVTRPGSAAAAKPASAVPVYGPTLPPPRTGDNSVPIFFPATPARNQPAKPARGVPVYRGSAAGAGRTAKPATSAPVYSGAKPAVTGPAAPAPEGTPAPGAAPGQEGSGIVVEGTAQPAPGTDEKAAKAKEDQATNVPPPPPPLPPPVMTGIGIPSQGNVMTGIVKPVYTQPGIMSQGNIVPGIYAPGAPSPGLFGAYGYGMSGPNVHTSYNPYNPGTSYRPPGSGATPYTQVSPGGITYGSIGYGNTGYNGAGYGGFGSRAYTPYFGQTGVPPGAVFYQPPR